MRKLILSVALASIMVPVSHAGPFYDFIMDSSSVTRKLSGDLLISASYLSPLVYTIQLRGATGIVTATGGFVGDLTGAASDSVLKAGDTMTGQLTVVSSVTVDGLLLVKSSVTVNGLISSPGAGQFSQRFGFGATANGVRAHVFGHNSSHSGTNSIAFGFGITGTGYQTTLLGNNTGDGGFQHVKAIGYSAIGTDHYQFVAGSGGAPTFDVFFGRGQTSADPNSHYVIHGTGGSGADTVGANVTIAGGQGTGDQLGGSFIVETSPGGSSGSSANALVERFRIDGNGDATIRGAVTVAGSSLTVDGLMLVKSSVTIYGNLDAGGGIEIISNAAFPFRIGTSSIVVSARGQMSIGGAGNPQIGGVRPILQITNDPNQVWHINDRIGMVIGSASFDVPQFSNLAFDNDTVGEGLLIENNSGDFAFYTKFIGANGARRMVIDGPTGSMALGPFGGWQLAPAATFELRSNQAPGGYVLKVSSQNGTTALLWVKEDGNVRIGQGDTTHTAALEISDIGVNADNYIVSITSVNGTTTVWAVHPNGHVQIAGADPTLGTCASGTIDTNSSDSGGIIDISGANSSCEVNFNSVWDAQPICLCQTVDSAPSTCRIDSLTTSVLTMSPSSALGSGDSYSYRCWGLHAE